MLELVSGTCFLSRLQVNSSFVIDHFFPNNK
jgi:hypothetical protein